MSLYRRKDSKVWWIHVKVKGKRIRISTETENRKRADRIHAKVLTDIEEGRWFENQIKRKTLKEMIERYKQEYTESKDYYPKSRDKSIFKNLHAFFGEEATLSDVEDRIGGYEYYRRSKKVKPATILKELGLLRRMFNIARKQWKWKILNPVSDIDLPKVKNERVRYLSPDEDTRLFDEMDKTEFTWLKPLVLVALDTGLRLTNLCELMRTDISFSDRMIILQAEKMKNDDYIGIPLSDRALGVLKDLMKVPCLSGHVFHDNGQRLYDRKVQRAFRSVLEKAKIENFHFHDLRHTFASYLRQRGVDLHTIAVLMGHRDLRMTKRYAHLNVDNMRDAIAKLGHVLVTVGTNEVAVSGVSA